MGHQTFLFIPRNSQDKRDSKETIQIVNTWDMHSAVYVYIHVARCPSGKAVTCISEVSSSNLCRVLAIVTEVSRGFHQSLRADTGVGA
jgi:hypothetical protein